MPIENLSQEAELRLKITSDDPKVILNAIAQLNKELGYTNTTVDKLEKNFSRLGTGGGRAASTAVDEVAKSGKNLKKEAAGLSDSDLPRLRYALYDVATTANITAAAIGATGLAAVVASAKYESAFANVERTLKPGTDGVAELRTQLEQLSREMPLAFGNIAEIATLGNQLGIEKDELIQFTEVVAKFSTLSGMSAEASAQAFGRLTNILQLPIPMAESLASAIELVGISSASTDAEIIALAQRLGATATRAGFTADQVIGLAGALGSLGVAPERAQGVFETYFNSLNESLDEGGIKLEAFSQVTGLTAEKLNEMVRSGAGFEVFQKFLQGLQGADTVQLTGALDALGLSGLRANEVIGRISQNLPLLEKAFATAAKGSADASELNRQYAIILETLSSKWQMFLNALMGFAAAAGNAVAPALKQLLDITAQLLIGITDFISSPVGEFFTRMIGSILAVVGVYAAFRGMLALTTGSLLALRTAASYLGGAGLAAGIRGLGVALGIVKTGAEGAAGGVSVLRGALLALGRATLIIGALQLLAELVFNFGGSMRAVVPVVGWFTDVTIGGMKALANFANLVADLWSQIPIIGGAAQSLKGLANNFLAVADTAGSTVKKGFSDWANGLESATDASDDFSSSVPDWTSSMGDYGNSLEGIGDGADDTAMKVRTLVDYANDLSGVMSRAFDIRFGPQQGLDTIASGWNSIADNAEKARQSISEYQAKMASLAADRSIKEYWLTIAEQYGDELRAAKIRADLADINTDMSKTSQDLSKAQQDASMSLQGNSAAAIQNRANLLGLVGNYQSYIQALASSGMGQDELSAKAAALKQQFIDQAAQMGFSREEVSLYTASFDDMSKAIGNVPRDITVTANVEPAVQALSEFFAQADASAYNAGLSAGSNYGAGLGDGIGSATPAWRNPFATDYAGFGSGGSSGRSSWRNGGGGSFATGGYTGGGGKFEPAGIVHKGEYVMSAQATRNLGVGNLAHLHSLGRAGRGFAQGSPRGGGSPMGGLTEIGPASIQALAQAIRSDFYLNDRLFASSVNSSNATNTAHGGG